ncbi:MAG: hypothetical protein ACJA0V_003168 [Planctomycetota bacterium]|jgi:hypothetical protein
MQPIIKDPLVAHERVLGTRLPMIARLPLPLAPPDLANAPDNPISRTASAASRLRGLDRRNDLHAATDCSVVQRAAVVGTVADDSTDLAWHAIDEVHANVAVINTRRPTITPSPSTPKCSFFQPRMPLPPCLAAAHLPSPKMASPQCPESRPSLFGRELVGPSASMTNE